MHEGLGGVYAGVKPQMSRAKTALCFLVEESGKHLLPDPVRITGQFFPALVEVDCVELLVLFLDRHVISY
ncbi:MAG: hypothetical protein E6H59_14455 [Betaproteobacteria bacterium]|nr:MAG: hypothetical protein E6H59_14455 [Betaproteobacteria bacterium]